MRALCEATEGDRLLGVAGAAPRQSWDPPVGPGPGCAYLAGERLVTVGWEEGNPRDGHTHHQGLQLVESEEEERG